MKKVLLLLSLFVSLTNYAQWCSQPNPDFCPGNYFTNGNFETITGNPNNNGSNDINLSSGWLALWAGGGGTSDLACAGTAHGLGSIPTPNSGVYSGMWIINSPNRTNENRTYREGMYNKLATAVPSNSGNYTFNFDIANGGGSSNASVLIDIYGVHNPSDIVGTTPVNCYNPSNYNLWAADPTVDVVLLGTITTPVGLTNTWTSQSITFNSNIATSSITHIMIARSEQVVTTWSKRYINFDNFCMQLNENNEGAFCCPGENLAKNGNFENGNIDFGTNYNYQSSIAANSILPGQYGLVSTSEALTISPQWHVEDHTFCENGTNSDMLIINGRTQQPTGTSSVVYENSFSLNPSKEYKFCLNAKNLPQCTFDVLPEFRIEVLNGYFTNGYSGNWLAINTDAADPCDWFNLNACIRSNRSDLIIKIHLKEDGNGDGNDIAFDDISVQEKLEQDNYITVQHTGANNDITASLNTIDTVDDIITENEECGLQSNYFWFAYEISSYPISGPLSNISPGTFAWSSNTVGWNNQTSSVVSPGWSLTTTFPGYTFDNNKLYAIGMYIPSCCTSCYDEKWIYQITYNYSARSTNEQFNLTQEMKNEIKSLFIKGNSTTESLDLKENINIYPNPSSDLFNISFPKLISGELDVFDTNGRLLVNRKIKDKKSIQVDLSKQTPGIYLLKVKSPFEEYNSKLIKK